MAPISCAVGVARFSNYTHLMGPRLTLVVLAAQEPLHLTFAALGSQSRSTRLWFSRSSLMWSALSSAINTGSLDYGQKVTPNGRGPSR